MDVSSNLHSACDRDLLAVLLSHWPFYTAFFFYDTCESAKNVIRSKKKKKATHKQMTKMEEFKQESLPALL